jgi:hypothetical protein
MPRWIGKAEGGNQAGPSDKGLTPKGVRRMLRRLILAIGIGAMAIGCTGVQAAIVEGEPRVEIWTDRGTGGVYRVGDDMEVCLRADRDCYVIVYEIDTDGHLRLLFPYHCGGDGFVEGGVVYRLGGGYYGTYYVTGPSGVEYVHALASIRPFRTLYWHGCDGYENYAYDVSWRGFGDYWGCALPPRVYGDPYMAMQSIDEFICYDYLESGAAFADFTYFYVDERVSYPRYVCYDCHGFDTYYRPYVHVCTGFSIGFIDCDPCWNPWSWWWWCTPRRVYCGPRYVCSAKRSCRDWPSRYKWKSRSDCYSSRSEYAHYWDERVHDRTPRVVDTGGARKYKAGERDLYVRDPKRVEKHKDVAVREGRVEVIRPVPARTGRTDKVKSDARRSAERAGNETRIPAPVRVKEVQVKKPRVAEKPAKVETRKVTPKPKRAPVKVESKKASKASNDAKASRKATVRSSGKTSTKNKKVAPKVRTGSSKGRSPSKRRRVSK